MSHEHEETTNPGAALSVGRTQGGFDHGDDSEGTDEGTDEVTQVDAPEHASSADVGTPADFDDSVLDDIAVPST